MKIYRLAQLVQDYSDIQSVPATSEYDDPDDYVANEYFSVGHGDEALKYIVWVWNDGRILTSPVLNVGEDGDSETHGTLWGHQMCDDTFKGRYEPETGKLSIVKPCNARFRDVPSIIMSKLLKEFSVIEEVRIF